MASQNGKGNICECCLEIALTFVIRELLELRTNGVRLPQLHVRKVDAWSAGVRVDDIEFYERKDKNR
jgi:hypothetical protein